MRWQTLTDGDTRSSARVPEDPGSGCGSCVGRSIPATGRTTPTARRRFLLQLISSGCPCWDLEGALVHSSCPRGGRVDVVVDDGHERSSSIRKAPSHLDYVDQIHLLPPLDVSPPYATGERVRTVRCQRCSRRICYPQKERAGGPAPARSGEERSTIWVTIPFHYPQWNPWIS